MPIYEYEPETETRCEHCVGRFEVFQKMSEEPIQVCPQCGAKVRRVFSPLAIHGGASSSQMLSNKNLAEKGFTKYVKAGDGFYEKAAGKEGPNVIRR